MSIEAMKQALEALEYAKEKLDYRCEESITSLRQAIAEAEKQEPVAWELRKGKTDRVLLEITNDPKRAHDWNCSLEEVVPLYTHPPKQWQGLTDEDIKEIIGYHGDLNANGYTRQLFAKIEAKLREKNG